MNNTVKEKKLEGLIAAPMTGYKPDGSVNLDIVADYAYMLHANGVAGAFVNGTTGEGLSLTLDERFALAERWVQAAPDGFKVIIHVGHTCQETSRELARQAAAIGVDAIGEIGPVFYRPQTVDALVDYIAQTAATTPSLPYYYYHMPSMNQVDFPMIDLLERVDDIPNFAGIKYTHEDLDDYQRCVQFDGGKYAILLGRDELLLEGLQHGAQGAVGSTYNIMAPLYTEMIKTLGAGDIKEAQRLQVMARGVIDILAGTGCFFSALKMVARSIGLEMGGNRRPLQNLAIDAGEKMMDAMKKTGVIQYLNTMHDQKGI